MALENVITTAGLAVALGCDAFAVGLGVGLRHCNPRQVFRLSFHFGFFQFAMPVAGWYLGQGANLLVGGYAGKLAALLLFYLGYRMIKEGLESQEEEELCGADPTRGLSLVALSLATSIDALGAGLSLGASGAAIWISAVVIGLTAALMTLAAMLLAGRISKRFGNAMDVAGGVILIAIGIKMLF